MDRGGWADAEGASAGARTASSLIIPGCHRRLALRVTLHRHFRLEALDIPVDRGDREHAPVALIAQQAVPRHDVPHDRQLVPRLGVADIVDRDIVVLAPEERHRDELLAPSEHVERGGLALALGDDPVLDADALAAVWIRPARDVARREDSGRAGFQISVHDHATVELEAGLFGKFGPRAHADAGDYKVGLKRAAALQRHPIAVDGADGVLQVEDHAVLLVQGAHEITDLRAQNPLHRPLFRCHYMDLDLAGAR